MEVIFTQKQFSLNYFLFACLCFKTNTSILRGGGNFYLFMYICFLVFPRFYFQSRREYNCKRLQKVWYSFSNSLYFSILLLILETFISFHILKKQGLTYVKRTWFLCGSVLSSHFFCHWATHLQFTCKMCVATHWKCTRLGGGPWRPCICGLYGLCFPWQAVVCMFVMSL